MEIEKENLEKISAQEVEMQARKFQYELIQESIMKQKFYCRSFEFNKDNKILIIAIRNEIVIYEFKDYKITNELQRLNHNDNEVTCLYFMKNSNSFVSAGDLVVIWILDQNNKLIVQQVLKTHLGQVNCVVMNKMENQLISCSKDGTIKFWSNNQGNSTCSQSILPQKYSQINNMSLNEMEDELIDNNIQPNCIYILILQYQNEWKLIQKIDYHSVVRLSFTVEDQFVLTTENSGELQVYDYDTVKQQFCKVKEQSQKAGHQLVVYLMMDNFLQFGMILQQTYNSEKSNMKIDKYNHNHYNQLVFKLSNFSLEILNIFDSII